MGSSYSLFATHHSRRSPEVFPEPGGRAIPRLLVRGLVVAAALVAAEAVAGALVDVDVAIRPLLLDRVDVGHRDRLVLVAEMQLRRHPRLEVDVLGDLAAVVADRRGEPVELAGRQERDRAAHAVSDDADLAGTLDVADRRRDIEQQLAPVDLRNERARMRDLVGRVAAFEIGLDAIEHGGRRRGVADRREAIAHGADVVVHAEDLLDHHQAAFRLSLRFGTISAELESVRSRECDVRTQGATPFRLGNRRAVEVKPAAPRRAAGYITAASPG